MASLVKFNAFVADIANKVHNLGSDTLKVALTNTAPSATNAILSDITEISYTNCSSRTLTVSSSTQTSGTYACKIADLTLTASGGSVGAFRYVVFYNSTPVNGNLCWYYDYGSSITLASGESLVIDLDNSTGAITIV